MPRHEFDLQFPFIVLHEVLFRFIRISVLEEYLRSHGSPAARLRIEDQQPLLRAALRGASCEDTRHRGPGVQEGDITGEVHMRMYIDKETP